LTTDVKYMYIWLVICCFLYWFQWRLSIKAHD